MNNLKVIRFSIVMLICSITLVACGVGANNVNEVVTTPGQDSVLETEVISGGEAIWLSNSAPPTLDPHVATDVISRNAMRQMYETLMTLDDNNDIVFQLAQSYTLLDENTWEFNLRQGVIFHDGTPFNSYAVAINFERLLDPANAFPRANFLEMVSSVEIIDEYTVHFITDEPFMPLPAQLSNYTALIISPSAIHEQNEGGRLVTENPIGTGPFKLYNHEPGNYIRFVRFDDHWYHTPILDSLLFRIIPDASTRIALLESGEAHGMIAMLSDVAVFETMPNIDVQSVLSTRIEYLGFNTNVQPFDDIRVRRAITKAVNLEDILYGVADGQGVLAVGPIAPNVTHSAPDVPTIPFDPDLAREILQELDLYRNLETEIWFYDGNSVMARTAELVQSNLLDVGITVSLHSMERGAYLEATAAGEKPMFFLGWTGGTGDPDIQVSTLFDSVNFGIGGNRFFYYNTRVDELINQGRITADFDERSAIYREITEILVYEAPVIFLYHPMTPIATTGITGLRTDFTFTPYFYNVSLIN